METVSISTKFQVVIPKSVRQTLGLKAGTRVQVFVYGDRIELVPVRRASDLRGFLKGIKTDIPQEEDRL